MPRVYKIHFVCRGNVFRSRLAEAMIGKLHTPGIEVSSSGIETWHYNLYPPEHVTHYSALLRDELGLTKYFAKRRTQTSEELLDAADLIVFMSPDVHKDALKHFTFNPYKAIIWRVNDAFPQAIKMDLDPDIKEDVLTAVRATVRHLQALCSQLDHTMRHVGWSDVVDKNNQELGFQLPSSIIDQKGLWRRGAHVVITLPNKRFLVEKRSESIIYDPKLLDITLGGGVDSGEKPSETAARETKEELGLSIPEGQFHLIDNRKWDAYHPRYRANTKIILYTYHVKLTTNAPLLRIQRKEVAAVHALTYRQIIWLIRVHRLKQIGRIKSSYKYFHTIVAASREYI